MARLILASSSPRRRELLEQLGLVFDIYSPDIDESVQVGESVADYVERLACAKACLLYTSPSPRDLSTSRMPSSA